MTQPTKEEAGKVTARKAASIADCAKAGYFQAEDIMRLAAAYIALMEEHKSNVDMWQNIVNKLQKTCEEADTEIAQLQAENLALREEVKMLEDELEATEMDRGVMIAANGKKIQLIEELQAYNEALRARLLKCHRTLSSWTVKAPK